MSTGSRKRAGSDEAEAQLFAPDPKPDVARGERAAPTRILVVEDSDDHSELLLRQLRKSHLDSHVRVIADGREAWDYLAGDGREAGLVAIFLDLHLPSLDGVALLERIRADDRLRNLPVIVITSAESPSVYARCRELRVTAFIAKPVSFSSFSKAVADVFHSAETRRLPRPE